MTKVQKEGLMRKPGPGGLRFSLQAIPLPRPALLLGALAALGMALLLAQTSLVASTGYHVEQMEELKAARQRQNQALEAEIGYLRSLDRIEQEARTRLKMITPTTYVYITVDTLPQDPTPLLKKALRESGASSLVPRRPWWENLPFAYFFFRREL